MGARHTADLRDLRAGRQVGDFYSRAAPRRPQYRILAYVQYLAAYKTVMIGSMSEAFGVGESFLDAEVARFERRGKGGYPEMKVRHCEQNMLGVE